MTASPLLVVGPRTGEPRWLGWGASFCALDSQALANRRRPFRVFRRVGLLNDHARMERSCWRTSTAGYRISNSDTWFSVIGNSEASLSMMVIATGDSSAGLARASCRAESFCSFCSVSVLFCICSRALLKRFTSFPSSPAASFCFSRCLRTLGVLESEAYWRLLQLHSVQSSLMNPRRRNSALVSAISSMEMRIEKAMDVSRSVS